MDSRTQQLVSLIAGDAGQRLLAELLEGSQTNAELKESTGLGGTAVDHLLELLLAYGIADFEVDRSSRPGRPGRRWAITRAGATALKKFESQAAELRRRLTD